jgi:aspartyl/glutamyl-tRNA(Asn/Gln) amidotransferase C subunit
VQIDKLLALSKIHLDDQEKEQLKQDVTDIVGLFDKISSIDTDDIQPMYHGVAIQPVNLSDDRFMSGTPEKPEFIKDIIADGEHFTVPSIITKGE